MTESSGDRFHDPAALSAAELTLLERRFRPGVRNGHALLAETLRALGLTHVYGIPGTPVEETFARCAAAGIRPIGVRHQQAAVMMSAAQNYISGALTAVALLSAGPAVTNAATGILVAHDNGWPALVLGGRRPLNMRGLGSFQELDAVPIFSPVTKWASVVGAVADLPRALARAVTLATVPTPGPVYLDLPEDMLSGVSDQSVDPAPPASPPDLAVRDEHAIRSVADTLLGAERPVLIVGPRARWGETYEHLQSLVQRLGLPFVSAPSAHGLIADDHPLCFTAISRAVQKESDAVFLFGAALDWSYRFGADISPDARFVRFDIEPSAGGLSPEQTVAIAGDIGVSLQQLLRELDARGSAGGKFVRYGAWIRSLCARRTRRLDYLEALCWNDAQPMTLHRLMREIRDALPEDVICILDGNLTMAVAQQVIPSRAPLSRLTAGANGCMGTGIPFAIGTQLGRPERPVVVITGDTAFGFNATEMETAVRHHIPIVVVIANNGGHSGALKQSAMYPGDYAERVAMFQPALRYEQMVAAVGGYGEFVEEASAVGPALERAFAAGTAACINVQVDPHAPYPVDQEYPES